MGLWRGGGAKEREKSSCAHTLLHCGIRCPCAGIISVSKRARSADRCGVSDRRRWWQELSRLTQSPASQYRGKGGA